MVGVVASDAGLGLIGTSFLGQGSFFVGTRVEILRAGGMGIVSAGFLVLGVLFRQREYLFVLLVLMLIGICIMTGDDFGRGLGMDLIGE